MMDVTDRGTVVMKLFSSQQQTSSLRNAFVAAGIQLAYEPMIHLPSGQLWGIEVRILKTTQQGQLIVCSADELISLAQSSGYALPVGYWALETALRELQPWFQEHQQEYILIHLHRAQITSPHLLETVHNLCQQFGLHPSRLKLQISEAGLQLQGHKILRQMQRKPHIQPPVVIDTTQGSGADFSWLKSGLIHAVKVTPPRHADTRLYTQQIKTLMVFKNLMNIEIIGCDIHTLQELQELRNLECEIGMGPSLHVAVDKATLIRSFEQRESSHEA